MKGQQLINDLQMKVLNEKEVVCNYVKELKTTCSTR